MRAGLAIARRQRAKLLELAGWGEPRPPVAPQGERAQARELLAGLCESFAGGDPCRDLAEARAVLGAGWFRTAR